MTKITCSQCGVAATPKDLNGVSPYVLDEISLGPEEGLHWFCSSECHAAHEIREILADRQEYA